jgi:hypothetical protein
MPSACILARKSSWVFRLSVRMVLLVAAGTTSSMNSSYFWLSVVSASFAAVA